MDILSSLAGNLFHVFIVLAFLAAVLLSEGLYLTWRAYKGPEARRIERRLQGLSGAASAAGEASILKQRLLNEAEPLQRLLLRLPRGRELDQLLQQAGSRLTVSSFAGFSAAAAFGVFLLVLLVPLLHWVVALAAGALAGALPLALVVRQRAKRIGKIVEQLPDALDLISRALRAGHAFPSGLQMVAEETSEPIGAEFRLVNDEINFGVAVPAALANLAARVPHPDVRHFVIAVLIQRETGGNLTELLASISSLIRERLKLFLKIRVLSAEGRLSAMILMALPFFLAAVINMIHPKFMAVLWTDPMGLQLVYSTIVMMTLGGLWMRRIVRIRV